MQTNLILAETHPAEIIAAIVVLLLLAAATLAIAERLKLPFTVLLFLVGALLAWISDVHVPLPLLGALRITPELILYVFLPALIFDSAYQLDMHQLRHNLGPVLTLAVPGLLLSTAVIGMIFAFATGIPLPVALLLGAILSATDPAAVITVFRQLGVPPRLIVLVEGESLFNDAASIVVARTLLSIVVVGSFTTAALSWGIASFLIAFAGGLLAGWVLALVVGYVLSFVESNRSIEITLTTSLAYLSFVLAEEFFHVSGVMATAAAGLTLGGWGQTKISSSVRSYLEHFWEYVAFVASAMIFLLVGWEVHLSALWESAGLVVLIIICMLVSRAMVVFGLMPLINRLPRQHPVSLGFQTVMYWGGLRGAIAFAMVLSLPDDFAFKEMFTSVVIGAVFFTLLVQGLTIEPLVHLLGLGKEPLSDRFARIEGALVAKQSAIRRIGHLQSGGLFSGPIASELQARCDAELASLRNDFSELRKKELTHEQERALLSLRSLSEEKSIYIDMFDQGHISEYSFRSLMQDLTLEVDAIRETNHYHELYRERLAQKLERRFLKLIDRWPAISWLAERRRLTRVARDYEYAWGKYQGSARVLEHLDELACREETPASVVQEVRIHYAIILVRSRGQLDRIAEQFPEFVNSMQQHLGRRMVLLAEVDAIRTEARHGTIPLGVLGRMEHQIARKLRQQSRLDTAPLQVAPAELLRKVPMFQGISACEFETVAARMQAHTVSEQETIVRQGDYGDSLYLIARGVLRVSRTESGTERDLATLLAGDFFGEMAIQSGHPRNATVRAITPCVLYELRHQDLAAIVEQFPTIARALDEASRSRQAAGQARASLAAEAEKRRIDPTQSDCYPTP